MIKWYQSKLVWTGIGTALLGITPLVAVFLNVVIPAGAIIINAAAVLLVGILTIILRVGATDRPIM